MKKRIRSLTQRILPVMALFAVACSSSTNVIGPDNQLEVANATDSFQWQVSALDKVAQVLEYSWVNTGTTANVNQSSSLSGGTATVQVKDGSGAIVYTRSLAENGTRATSAGIAGTWTITVTLDNAQGTLNFRLQKP